MVIIRLILKSFYHLTKSNYKINNTNTPKVRFLGILVPIFE